MPAFPPQVGTVSPYPVFLAKKHWAAQQHFLKGVLIMTGTDIHIRRLNPSLIKALDEKATKLKRNRNDLIIGIIENAVSHDLFTATEEKYQALSNQYMQAFEQVVENNTQVLRCNTEAYLQIRKLLDGVFENDDTEMEEENAAR